MRVKVYAKTPKGKAEKTSKTSKETILGVLKDPIDTVIVNDSLFYYLVDIENDKQMDKLVRRIASAETHIKQFYRVLIKTIKWTNKMSFKCSWAFKKIKARFIKKLEDLVKDPKNKFIKSLKEDTDESIKELIALDGIPEMQRFLEQGELIYLEVEYEK